jgi:hypothetical protein
LPYDGLNTYTLVLPKTITSPYEVVVEKDKNVTGHLEVQGADKNGVIKQGKGYYTTLSSASTYKIAVYPTFGIGEETLQIRITGPTSYYFYLKIIYPPLPKEVVAISDKG